ncbi:MAG: hypothetical protein AAF718_13660 [Pseudomonadota bacterium]
MKKRKPSARKRRQEQQSPSGAYTPNRRDVMKLARNGLIGSAVLGGGGLWAHSSMRAFAAEHDLTRVGQGKPAVVQIHDPQCAMCTELQREARAALKCYEREDLVYLVASTRTNEGSAFAATLGLPHVTLVLMDEVGDVSEVLQGVRHRDELKGHFDRMAPRRT